MQWWLALNNCKGNLKDTHISHIIRQQKLIILPTTLMGFLWFYSAKPSCQVRILIYRNWATVTVGMLSCFSVNVHRLAVNPETKDKEVVFFPTS